MRKYFIVLLLAIVAFTAACGGGDDEATDTTSGDSTETTDSGDSGDSGSSGDVAAGEEVYASTCAACHGADGTGVQGLGKSFVDSEFVADTSDADLVAFIETGRPASDPANTTGVDMPPKGGNPSLTEEDLANVVAFIKSINEVSGSGETTTSAP